MLVDELELTIKSGDGGEGIVSFGKGSKSGPDGGNGGNGGDVYIIASSDLSLLSQFHDKGLVSAEDGIPGGKNKMAGRNGKDMVMKLPVGTLLKDKNTKEIFELENVGEQILLCKGGKGGIGNFELRSSVNTTPRSTVPAKPSQVRNMEIKLRFIADFGLVGLPSAGKSSLLNELTNTKVKTAEYHFTTLSPNLGVLANKKIIADIPGLIKGASKGKGLGIKFLKHIQKVGLILHCLSSNSPNIIDDYKVVRKELGKFSKELLKKDEIILLTKSDLVDEDTIKKLKTKIKTLKKKVITTSIYDEKSIKKLTKVLV